MSPFVVKVDNPTAPLRLYERPVQVEDPSPIFYLPVSVSKPISPAANVGLVEVQVAAVLRLT